MKIKCPNCKTGIRIGRQSRFQWFDCPRCKSDFHGLESEVSLGSWILDDPFETGCPHCWRIVRLCADSPRGGFYGPARCCWCGKKLENGRYGRPLRTFHERNAIGGGFRTEKQLLRDAPFCSPAPIPASLATRSDDNIEAARIVADVQAGRLPAPLPPDEYQMTPEEESEYQELVRGFAELDRKKADKNRRQKAIVAAMIDRFKGK